MRYKNTARIVGGTAVAALLLVGSFASAQSTMFSSQFGVGARGDNVTNLQTWLSSNGYYDGPVTGYYGPLTQAAVKRYQTSQGISATGYVGPLTLAALNASSGGSVAEDAAAKTILIKSLEAQLQVLLAKIQALMGSSQSTTTGSMSPAGSNLSLSTNAGSSVSATLGATGTGPFTYAITSNPKNGTVGLFNTMTGAFTYTPNMNYSGSDTFSYTVRNNTGVSSPMTVTVTVGASTTAPTGQTMSFSTSNGAAYSGMFTANGTSPFTYAISTSPSHGTISNLNASTGAFTYTPTGGYTGSDSFMYTVSNSAGMSSPITITVTNNASSTGVATGQAMSFTTSNSASYNGTLSGSGSGSLTYGIVTQPMHGTINSFTPATGAFTYTPYAGYHGSDTFTYTVTNSLGTSAANTVTITN